jgi:hypothetical protein
MNDATFAKLLTGQDGPEAALLTLAKLLTGVGGLISDTETRALECWLDARAQANPETDQ